MFKFVKVHAFDQSMDTKYGTDDSNQKVIGNSRKYDEQNQKNSRSACIYPQK